VLRKDPECDHAPRPGPSLAAGAEKPGRPGRVPAARTAVNESFGIYLLAAARKPAAQGVPRRVPRPPANAATGPVSTGRPRTGTPPGAPPGGLPGWACRSPRAFAVAAVLDALQRIHDLRTLGHRRGQHRLGAVGLGQAAPYVRLVLRGVRGTGHGPLAAQDPSDGTVQVVACGLKTLAYGDWSPRIPPCFIRRTKRRSNDVSEGRRRAQGPQNKRAGGPSGGAAAPPGPGPRDSRGPRITLHGLDQPPGRCAGPS